MLQLPNSNAHLRILFSKQISFFFTPFFLFFLPNLPNSPLVFGGSWRPLSLLSPQQFLRILKNISFLCTASSHLKLFHSTLFCFKVDQQSSIFFPPCLHVVELLEATSGLHLGLLLPIVLCG